MGRAMSEALVLALQTRLGQAQVLVGEQIDARYKTDWSRAVVCEPVAVVKPRHTEDMSAALAICHEHDQPVTVQGGMTGLVGGSQVNDGEVVISLERLQGIEEIDPAAGTMTLWAGTPLQVAQQAAVDQGLCVAVDLGARGSCQVGGNISTNAGGNRVIRYGMMREQVLGMEVVMADGTIVTSLNKMLKNNAGYDLKHWFIGSEGEGVRFQLRGESPHEKCQLRLSRFQLRQWLNILRSQYLVAQWPLSAWPQWLQPNEASTVTAQASGRALH